MKKLALLMIVMMSLAIPATYLVASTCNASGCGYDVTAIGASCECSEGDDYVSCTAYDEDGDWISVEITCE